MNEIEKRIEERRKEARIAESKNRRKRKVTYLLDVLGKERSPITLQSLGGTFMSQSYTREQREGLGLVKHNQMRIFGSTEFTPEIAEDERVAREFAANRIFGSDFIPIEEMPGDYYGPVEGTDEDEPEELAASY